MFTDPVKNLKAFRLREDSIVADLGAGTGFYSLALGPMIPMGKVYAVEIVKDYLTTLKNKVKEARIHNIEIIWGNVEKIGGTKIGDGIVDAVIASNILFQVVDKDKFIEEIRRILKIQGRVLLIDWIPESSGVSTQTAILKIKAREMLEKRGFIFDREIDAGEHHYGMIFNRGQ